MPACHPLTAASADDRPDDPRFPVPPIPRDLKGIARGNHLRAAMTGPGRAPNHPAGGTARDHRAAP